MSSLTELRRAARNIGISLAAVVVGLLVIPTPAFAHASLASSNPADGATVPAVDRIELTFTKSFSVVSPGIQLDGSGQVVPTALSVQDRVATLTPATTLAPGAYGVRWNVKAPDSHPRSGSFTFTLAGNNATPTTDSLKTALASKSSTPFDLLGAVGRFVLYAGVMLVIGALAIGFFVARASAREARGMVLFARRAGLLVGIGTLVTVVAQAALYAGPGIPWPWKLSAWGNALGSAWGLSILLLLGSCVLLIRTPGPKFAPTDTWLHTETGTRAAPVPADEASNTAHAVLNAPPHNPFVAGGLAWRSGYATYGALALMLAGLAINGHSQSASPLALAWIANGVHVLAAGVWGGGVVLLVALVARRRASNNPALVADAPLQFSRVATLVSIAAGLTGILLAAIELPSFSALFHTSFGRILLAKMFVVAVIAGLGAWHHFTLLPALHADPSAARAQRTWAYLRIEAIGFALVIVLTAFLASASYQ
ncbi:MAG: copper resistance CopC/CopD family protein [Acidimicrobiia bacterium]